MSETTRSRMTKDERREDSIQKEMGRCKHYTAPGMTDAKTKCAAGLCYEDLARPLSGEELFRARASGGDERQWGLYVRIPCFAKNGADCPSRELPTREEAEATETRREESTRRFLEGMSKARPAIVDDIKARGLWEQNANGSIPCPACITGTLRYRYAGSYNGHIHGHCSTEGCVSWME